MMGTGTQTYCAADASDLHFQNTPGICLAQNKRLSAPSQGLKDGSADKLFVGTNGEWKFPASTMIWILSVAAECDWFPRGGTVPRRKSLETPKV